MIPFFSGDRVTRTEGEKQKVIGVDKKANKNMNKKEKKKKFKKRKKKAKKNALNQALNTPREF